MRKIIVVGGKIFCRSQSVSGPDRNPHIWVV